jgi:hypothetical protein
MAESAFAWIIASLGSERIRAAYWVDFFFAKPSRNNLRGEGAYPYTY